jgi:HEXXH motif-containing protein
MVDIQEYYRGFSYPQYGLDERFVAVLLAHDVRALGRAFLARSGAVLDRHGRNLRALLDHWLDGDLPLGTTWHPTTGLLEECLSGGGAPVALRTGAALGMLASHFGTPGEWELEFDGPTRLWWDRWLLPPARKVRVVPDSEAVSVFTWMDGAETATLFRPLPEGWHDTTLWPAPRVDFHWGPITLLLKPSLQDRAFDELRAGILPETEGPALVKIFERCIAVLDDYAPEYVTWIARVLRSAIPLRSDGHRTTSGSWLSAPGLIHVSADVRPAALAELLVHEATHQYFLILRRLGPVDDGSDRGLHYSPLTKTKRPIERILLGYHAFANILLLYRLLQAAGAAEREYCRSQEAQVVASLAELHGVLARSTALTRIGRALWEPLVARLQDAAPRPRSG